MQPQYVCIQMPSVPQLDEGISPCTCTWVPMSVYNGNSITTCWYVRTCFYIVKMLFLLLAIHNYSYNYNVLMFVDRYIHIYQSWRLWFSAGSRMMELGWTLALKTTRKSSWNVFSFKLVFREPPGRQFHSLLQLWVICESFLH